MTHSTASRNVRLLFWAYLFGGADFLQPVYSLFYYSRELTASQIVLLRICSSQ